MEPIMHLSVRIYVVLAVCVGVVLRAQAAPFVPEIPIVRFLSGTIRGGTIPSFANCARCTTG